MENTDYDVVIVGAGIAGAIVAKTLVDAGKNVLLLEAGLDEGIALHGKAALAVQASYLSRFYQAGAKAPNSPYPPIRNALSADVLDITTPNNANPNKGYLVQAGPLPFGSDNLIAAGGTTQHWLGTSLRMLPNDFRESEKYKHGVDWPIEYKHLISYYEMAEFEIGVSGTALVDDLPIADDDKPGYYGKDYVFPMKMIPQSYLDKQILKKTHGLQVKMNGKPYTVKCISTPQGRNSEPEEGYQYGGIIWDKAKKELTWQKSPNGYQPVGSLWDRNTGLRCEGNASCVPICPVQAKYNALKTLKKAVVVSQNCTAGHLDIITQAFAGIKCCEFKRQGRAQPDGSYVPAHLGAFSRTGLSVQGAGIDDKYCKFSRWRIQERPCPLDMSDRQLGLGLARVLARHRRIRSIS
jgi:choline dehydrogenase-like flavoprotein